MSTNSRRITTNISQTCKKHFELLIFIEKYLFVLTIHLQNTYTLKMLVVHRYCYLVGAGIFDN